MIQTYCILLKDDYTALDGACKMVLVVNMDLNMGKGKIAAQCGHAVLGAYKIATKSCPSAVKYWEMIGQVLRPTVFNEFNEHYKMQKYIHNRLKLL